MHFVSSQLPQAQRAPSVQSKRYLRSQQHVKNNYMRQYVRIFACLSRLRHKGGRMPSFCRYPHQLPRHRRL